MSHHERYDGGGYPNGLKSETIPLGARIFSIIDTYDAIVSDRPYRAGSPPDKARGEIGRHSGTQFDNRLVSAFLSLPEAQLEGIRKRYVDPAPTFGVPESR